MPKHIIALALVTQDELERLGANFNRAYPINDVPCFGKLLAAIDEADRESWRDRDARTSASARDEEPLRQIIMTMSAPSHRG